LRCIVKRRKNVGIRLVGIPDTSQLKSVLGDIDKKEIWSASVDPPTLQLPKKMRKKIANMSRVADDEEVYFAERGFEKEKRRKEPVTLDGATVVVTASYSALYCWPAVRVKDQQV